MAKVAASSGSAGKWASEPARTKYLGGSDAAAVLGISHWKTPYQLWCEKIGVETPGDLSGIDYVYFGTLLEPIVAQVFSERVGLKVRVLRKLVHHAKYSFMAGHIDRDVLNENAFLECKTANSFDYRDWGKSEEHSPASVPAHYLPQLDHYMMVRSATHCYMSVLIGGSDFRWYRIERDAKREAKLIDAELRFWDRVLNDDPPDVATEKDAKHRWKKLLEGTSIPVTAADRVKIIRLSKVQKDISELEKEEKTLRNWLFPLFQDREFLSENGDALARLSTYARTYFDIEEFRAKHPKIAKKFTSLPISKRLKILV